MPISGAGALVKTTNSVYVLGVVGQTCIQRESPVPTNNTKAPSNPRSPTPPWISGSRSNSSGGSSSGSCGNMERITWEQQDTPGGPMVKYGALVPSALKNSGASGVSLPAGCAGVSEPYRVN